MYLLKRDKQGSWPLLLLDKWMYCIGILVIFSTRGVSNASTQKHRRLMWSRLTSVTRLHNVFRTERNAIISVRLQAILSDKIGLEAVFVLFSKLVYVRSMVCKNCWKQRKMSIMFVHNIYNAVVNFNRSPVDFRFAMFSRPGMRRGSNSTLSAAIWLPRRVIEIIINRYMRGCNLKQASAQKSTGFVR